MSNHPGDSVLRRSTDYSDAERPPGPSIHSYWVSRGNNQRAFQVHGLRTLKTYRRQQLLLFERGVLMISCWAYGLIPIHLSIMDPFGTLASPDGLAEFNLRRFFGSYLSWVRARHFSLHTFRNVDDICWQTYCSSSYFTVHLT